MRRSLLVCLVLAGCGTGVGGGIPKDSGTDEGDTSAPLLTVSVTELDFGAIALGELKTATVSLTNGGGSALALTSLTAESPFTVSPGSATIDAGSTLTVVVNVQATTYEDFAKTLTIATDDDTIGSVTLPLFAATIADADADGYDVVAAGGDDCNDEDDEINPGAEEEWYDGTDQDCDGLNDFDRDGDGYEAETDDHHPTSPDCIDSNPDIHPGAQDTPYDGIDTDCAGGNDYDQDGDGYLSLAYGMGSDCDDFDASVNIEATEGFNGVDDDCDGVTDIDSHASTASYIYEADGSQDRAGYSVAIGDLDADGIAEIVVGSPYSAGSGGSNRGAVSIFLGGDLLPTGTALDDADNWFRATANSELMGSYVSVFGDFDGDGMNDLAIGAPGAGSNAGKVYVLGGEDALYGGDTGDALVSYTGSGSNVYLGRGLGTDIDLNGDGMDELVMAYASGSYNGVAIEYGSGTPSGSTMDAIDARFTTDGSEVAFYRNAPVGGDFDGDGYDDLIVSDGKADYGSTDNGAIWALWGSGSAYTGSADIESFATVINSGSASSSYNGWATALGDDWDGDGDGELWIFDAGDNATYVVEGGRGRSSFDASTAAAVTYSWSSSRPDAEHIRRAGDWTGDGIDDMMVFIEDQSGGYGLSELFSSELQSGTYSESSDIVGEIQGTTDYGNGNVGYGMAPLPGDVDGDGDDDFALGDPEFDSNAGESYVFLNRLAD